jgi:hypothetical protein
MSTQGDEATVKLCVQLLLPGIMKMSVHIIRTHKFMLLASNMIRQGSILEALLDFGRNADWPISSYAFNFIRIH